MQFQGLSQHSTNASKYYNSQIMQKDEKQQSQLIGKERIFSLRKISFRMLFQFSKSHSQKIKIKPSFILQYIMSLYQSILQSNVGQLISMKILQMFHRLNLNKRQMKFQTLSFKPQDEQNIIQQIKTFFDMHFVSQNFCAYKKNVDRFFSDINKRLTSYQSQFLPKHSLIQNSILKKKYFLIKNEDSFKNFNNLSLHNESSFRQVPQQQLNKVEIQAFVEILRFLNQYFLSDISREAYQWPLNFFWYNCQKTISWNFNLFFTLTSNPIFVKKILQDMNNSLMIILKKTIKQLSKQQKKLQISEKKKINYPKVLKKSMRFFYQIQMKLQEKEQNHEQNSTFNSKLKLLLEFEANFFIQILTVLAEDHSNDQICDQLEKILWIKNQEQMQKFSFFFSQQQFNQFVQQKYKKNQQQEQKQKDNKCNKISQNLVRSQENQFSEPQQIAPSQEANQQNQSEESQFIKQKEKNKQEIVVKNQNKRNSLKIRYKVVNNARYSSCEACKTKMTGQKQGQKKINSKGLNIPRNVSKK